MIDKKKIQLLANIPCVTLFERPMLKYIQRYFYAKSHEKIVNDRYLAFMPKKNNNGIIITIHIDRLGLVCTDGIITYSNYYGYCQYKKKYKPNIAFGKRFIGKNVRAYNPENGKPLSEGKVLDCQIDKNNKLVFDVKGIRCKPNGPSFPIAYRPDTYFKDGKITGQIDNFISIYAAYHLLKFETKYTILFTTEEEIGMSWRYISKFLDEYDYKKLIVLDSTSVEGLKELDNVDIVFRISDDLSEFGKNFVDKLIRLGDRCKVNYYIKAKNPSKGKIKTITELGRLMKESKRELEGATVQFPSIKYHTTEETTTLNSLKKGLEILQVLDSSLTNKKY